MFLLQVITWAKVGPNFCHHRASLGHNELKKSMWLYHVMMHDVNLCEFHCDVCDTHISNDDAYVNFYFKFDKHAKCYASVRVPIPIIK